MTHEPRVPSIPQSPRCAAHPARLAVDSCARCGRARCAPDAVSYGDNGCALCATAQSQASAPGTLEVGVRGALAALVTAFAGGWIATQHVNVHLMSLIVPGLLGLAVSWAAWSAAAAATATQRRLVGALAVLGAIAGTALGFRLFGRPITPVHPLDQVGPPYLTAIAGALAWPVLFAVPRRGSDRQPAGTRSNR